MPAPANPSTLRMQRSPLLTSSDLERIEQALVTILEDMGVACDHKAALDRLQRAGLRVGSDGRVKIDRSVTRRFLDDERERDRRRAAQRPSVTGGSDAIRLTLSSYPSWVHDPVTDKTQPFAEGRLIEAIRLCDALKDRGLIYNPPGLPCDAPPRVRPVEQYRLSATHARQGRTMPEIQSAETAPYIFEMADILGVEARTVLPVYVFSPLRVAGESLEYLLTMRERLTGFTVTSMPTLGGAAPIHVQDAFAMAAAEVVGSAILTREALGLPVLSWHVAVYAVDMASSAMVFGSPEGLLLQFMTAEVNAFLHGTTLDPSAGNIHTNATRPGAQASAEKTTIMAVGALLGARVFGAAGALALDDVFSAEQLLYDMESRDHVQRLIAGWVDPCDPDRALAQVKAGVEAGGFFGLDGTASEFRRVYWMPRLFERRFFDPPKANDAASVHEKALAEIHALLAAHDYELAGDQRKAVDAVARRARSRLG